MNLHYLKITAKSMLECQILLTDFWFGLTFGFNSVHFRGKFCYVGHVDYQKNQVWANQNTEFLEQDCVEIYDNSLLKAS